MAALDPRTAAGRYFNAAVAAFRRGDYAQAASYYRDGLAVAPDCASAYLDLAKVYEHLGDWDAALDALAVAFQLAPSHPTGIRRRDRILEEKRTYEALAERLGEEVCWAFQSQFLLTADESIGQASRETAARALSQAYWEMGTALEAFPSEPVVVHLLPATAIVRRGYPSWAAGIALGKRTIVAFLRQPNLNAGLLAALLRHEYAHLLVREVGGGSCPAWLDEAIAAWFAKPRMAWEEKRFQRAVAEGSWVPLSELTLPFTTLPADEVTLAYMECAKIGDYLATTYGVETFRCLLWELRAGKSADEAFLATLGFDVEALESRLFGGLFGNAVRVASA